RDDALLQLGCRVGVDFAQHPVQHATVLPRFRDFHQAPPPSLAGALGLSAAAMRTISSSSCSSLASATTGVPGLPAAASRTSTSSSSASLPRASGGVWALAATAWR